MIQVRSTVLSGCVELHPSVHHDERGTFVKLFQASSFEALGLAGDWKELFYSVTARGVVRGLHFQVPPADQTKLVSCLSGEVFDVVVDVRCGSPSYGGFHVSRLNGTDGTSVLVPSGFAHGFAALTDGAVVVYAVTSEHDPKHDNGLRWDSVPGIPWPFETPTVSARDAELPLFDRFVSPFNFREAADG